MKTKTQEPQILHRLFGVSGLSKERILICLLFEFIKSILPEHYYNKRFAELEKNSSAEIFSKRLIEWDFKNPPVASILGRSNGCGKTHLAVCLFKKYVYEFYSKQFADIIMNFQDSKYMRSDFPKPDAIFISDSNLMLEIQECYKSQHLSEKEILKKYSSCDLLVIDDIFSSRENEFARRTLFHILDERIDWKRKPTIVTGNYMLEDIAKIDTRLASRLENNLCLEIPGVEKNYRR
jgi:DNA replication protein DnaC